MNVKLKTKGELPLILDDEQKIVALDQMEDWQVDQLLNSTSTPISSNITACLSMVDNIVENWADNLTIRQWRRIANQKSLQGIPLPQDWMKVWRYILKDPSLRNSWNAARGGSKLGTYTYFWNIWAEECLDKYLDDMDKELLYLVDQGYLHSEIGDIMLHKYGEKFWKPRKENSTTTPEQVVNNYLYYKLPNKIVRQELYDYCVFRLNLMKKESAADR